MEIPAFVESSFDQQLSGKIRELITSYNKATDPVQRKEAAYALLGK